MTASSQLWFKVRCFKLLERTTRRDYSGEIVNAKEAHLLMAAYEAGFEPKEIVRLLVRRDKSLSRTAQGAAK